MQPHELHITDEELLLEADGELAPGRHGRIREHLEVCWSCRARKAELERSIADFVQLHRDIGSHVPPADASRTLLRARLAEAAATVPPPHAEAPGFLVGPKYQVACAVAAVLLIAWGGFRAWHSNGRAPTDFAPNVALTPGAVRSVGLQSVCSAGASAEVRPVSAAEAHEVFVHYGISNPRPRSYEVDHLIPPALGGSNDVLNLWPQPYSTGVWNARVKDALEDRLRDLVCDGQLDLATAQRELARDWIAAYKKYFRTDKPLLSHVAFVKDHPWE